MAQDSGSHGASTRRKYLGRAGVLVAGGLVAGCIGGDGSRAATDEPAEGSTETAAPTETDTATPPPTPTETATEAATTEPPATYTASIEPLGEVTFERPPETVVSGWGFVGDVLLALGHADSVVGMSRPGFWYQGFYMSNRASASGLDPEGEARRRIYQTAFPVRWYSQRPERRIKYLNPTLTAEVWKCDSSQNPPLAVRRELSGRGGATDPHGHTECSGVNSSRPISGRLRGIKFACVRPSVSGRYGQNGEASGLVPEVLHELLPDVSMRDTTEIPAVVSKNYRIDRELLHELDPDLLAADPNRYIGWYGLDGREVRSLSEEIAPFFGNESRSKRSADWPNWPDGEAYSYYGVAEFVERYGRVFREEERAEAMSDLYESTIDDVISRVPPEDERPTVAVLNAFANPENRGFFAVNDPNPDHDLTHERKQYRDLGVVDAFAGKYPEAGGHYDLKTDMEGLAEVDPDVLVFKEAVNALGGQTVYGNNEAYEQTLDALRTDEVGKRLTAVQNDRLYPGGTGSQGPIISLFQTEMLAKQLYPEEFGEWPGFGKIPAAERLFDRQRVADIVNGEF